MGLPTGTVTFLFTDLEGSSRQWDEHPEAMRRALARHDALLRRSFESHGGHVFKQVGDAFCVAFQGTPEALDAALEAQLALAAEDWGALAPLRSRMALHTGSAEERNGDYFGPTLNRASRLVAIAHGGQTLLSQTVYDLVRDVLPPSTTLRDLGAHRLKDLQRPEHVFEVVHPGLLDEFPPLRSLDFLPTNLPLQPTSFIGRKRELRELRKLVPASRLVTLTGPGGSGKTRLAIQLAAELVETYPEGVWLIDLAPLRDPALVPQTVASALGVREVPGRLLTQTLADWLKPRRLLLLLDNCEHVVEACAQLAATVMRTCPDLTLLATSREVIGIPGEVVWSVPTLSAPDPRQLEAAAAHAASSLPQYEAVRLFIDRAGLVRPGFALTYQNARALAHICHRLDGIPLAIELAAGRVKALSPEQIAARLDDRFRLLTGGSRVALPRHQTLRATIDWSYELLSEPERAVLRRLSVFAGGWTLEAAEAVCAGKGVDAMDVLELQAHLIDKSLVIAEPEAGGETRYRLLATNREYAFEHLVREGEIEEARRRHAEFHVALAEKADPALKGKNQAEWLKRLESEHDNLRAALSWGRGQDRPVAARIACGLCRFWSARGYLAEGREWLERVVEDMDVAPALQVRVLNSAGVFANSQADYTRAIELWERALALGRTVGDAREILRSLTNLAGAYVQLGDVDRATKLLVEALAMCSDQKQMRASILGNLGYVKYVQGDSSSGRALWETCLQLNREIGDTNNILIALNNLTWSRLSEGNADEAEELVEEALALSMQLGTSTAGCQVLENMAWIAEIRGQDERAVSLNKEALKMARHSGGPRQYLSILRGLGALALKKRQLERAARLYAASSNIADAHEFHGNTPLENNRLEGNVAAIRSGLGEAAFERAWAEGRAMSLDEALELALDQGVSWLDT
jgi:predicted ATPase/class 3 adenylate cyclase